MDPTTFIKTSRQAQWSYFAGLADDATRNAWLASLRSAGYGSWATRVADDYHLLTTCASTPALKHKRDALLDDNAKQSAHASSAYVTRVGAYTGGH